MTARDRRPARRRRDPDGPDYLSLDPPDDTPESEYHYTHRRAALLRTVLDAGGPSSITQHVQADRFGVTQQQISQDLDALADHISAHLGRRHTLDVRAARDRAVRRLREQGDEKAAWDVMMDYAEWLGDRGAVAVVPDRREVDLNATVRRGDRTDSYEIVPDDAEVIDSETGEPLALDGPGPDDAPDGSR